MLQIKTMLTALHIWRAWFTVECIRRRKWQRVTSPRPQNSSYFIITSWGLETLQNLNSVLFHITNSDVPKAVEYFPLPEKHWLKWKDVSIICKLFKLPWYNEILSGHKGLQPMSVPQRERRGCSWWSCITGCGGVFSLPSPEVILHSAAWALSIT